MKKILFNTFLVTVFLIYSFAFVFQIPVVRADITNLGGDSTNDVTELSELLISGEIPATSEFAVATFAYRSSGGGELSDITSVSLNGTESFSFGCKSYDGEYAIELWYLELPSVGTYSIVANWTNPVDSRIGGTAFFSGVDTTNPVTNVDCNSSMGAWSNDPTLTFSSQAEDKVFAALSMYSGGNNVVPDGDFVNQEWNIPGGNVISSGIIANGSSNVNLSWSATQSWPWAIAAISIAPASGGTGGATVTGITNQKSGSAETYDYPYIYVNNFEVTGTDTMILVSVNYPESDYLGYHQINEVYFNINGTQIYPSNNFSEYAGNYKTEIFVLENPPVGIGSVVVGFNGNIEANNGAKVYAVALADVDYSVGAFQPSSSPYSDQPSAYAEPASSIMINYHDSPITGYLNSKTMLFSSIILEGSNLGITNITSNYNQILGENTSSYFSSFGYDLSSPGTTIEWTFDNNYYSAVTSLVVGFNTDLVADINPPSINFAQPSSDTILNGPFTFVGQAIDVESIPKTLTLSLDGGPEQIVFENNIDDNSAIISGIFCYFKDFNFSITDSLSEGSHSLEVKLIDSNNNENTSSFTLLVDSTGPLLNLISGPSAGSPNPGNINISGTLTDFSEPDSIRYTLLKVNNRVYSEISTNVNVTLSDTADPKVKEFDFDLSGLEESNYRLSIRMEDKIGLVSSYVIEFEVNDGPPVCILSNHPTPTDDTTPSYLVTCQSNTGIIDVSYRIYEVVLGDILPLTTIPSPTLGSYGDTYIQLEFTSPTSLADGQYIVEITATNANNVETYIDNRPKDYIVIEAVDNKPPILIFNEIKPNPTIDKTPTITGGCRDSHQFETNSMIDKVEYRINSGIWNTITSFDGTYDSSAELFSIELSDQGFGVFNIDVRCSDTAGNSTDDNLTSQTQTLEIVSPSPEDPDIITFTEEFSTQLRNSIYFTDAVWGNGIVRLREKISPTGTSIDQSNYGSRYGLLTFVSTYEMSEGTGDLIWYVKENEFVSYDRASGNTSIYSSSLFGINQFTNIAQTQAANGDILVWVTSWDGLLLFNATQNTYYFYNTAEFNSSIYVPNRITLDSRNGRTGAYIRLENENSAFNSRLIYIDTGSNFINPSDDTVTWYSDNSIIPVEVSYEIELDEVNNRLYVSTFGLGFVSGIGLLNDNNTPHNPTDDTRSFYSNGVETETINDIAIDYDTNTIFFSNTRTGSNNIQVISNDSGTPNDISDDNVKILAKGVELAGYTPQNIKFVPGPQYIGGQLFIATAEGPILYYNTNDSYTDTVDDTLIVLDITNYRFPVRPGNIIIDDYNTLYVNYDRWGLFKIDLERGWHDTNTAVAVAAPEENKQYVNHVSLDNLDIIARIDDQGVLKPESQAKVETYVSLDDGLTWNLITEGELKTFTDNDYRVRFKMNLSQNPGTTPIVNAYTLSYVSYQTAPDPSDITISASPSDVLVNEEFDLNIEIVDSLGYVVPNYNGPLQLILRDESNNDVTHLLGTNSAIATNGLVSLKNSISNTGTYRVEVTDGLLTGISNEINVTKKRVPSTPDLEPEVPEEPNPEPETPIEQPNNGNEQGNNGQPNENPSTGNSNTVKLDSIITKSDSTSDEITETTISVSDEVVEDQIDNDKSEESGRVNAEGDNFDLRLLSIPLIISTGLYTLFVAGLAFLTNGSLSGLFALLIPKKKKYYGKIYDEVTNEPIPFAKLKLKQGEIIEQEIVADKKGRYVLKASKGKHKIEIFADGYTKKIEDIEPSMLGEIVKDFGLLKENSSKLNPTKMFIKNFIVLASKYINIALIFLLLLGFGFTVYVLLVNFNFINLSIFLLYLVFLYLHTLSFVNE